MNISRKKIEGFIGKQLTQAEYNIYFNLLKTYSVNSELFNNNSTIQQKIFVTTLEAGYEAIGAKNFFQDSILESYNDNNVLFAANVFFSFPNPDNSETRKLLSGAVSGISQVASEIAVPILSSDANFSNSCTKPIVIIGTISAKIGKSTDDRITSKHLLLIEAGKEKDFVHPFSFKLIKECMLEIMQIRGATVYYSSDTHAALLAKYIKGSNFDACINFSDKSSKYQYLNNLSDSSKNCILVELPVGEAKVISAIANKWDLSATIIANVAKVKGCIIINNEIEQFEINEKTINLLTINSRLNQKKNQPIRKKNISVPKEIDINKELAISMISHPNFASKRWINEQFERFIGNNNLSVNYFSDCPVLLSPDNKIYSFTTNTNSNHYKDFTTGIISSILDNYRRTLATGSTPAHCLIDISDKALLDTDILQKVNQVSDELDISTQIDYSKNDKLNPYYVVSLLGNIEKKECLIEFEFKSKGDIIYLLGETKPSICNELHDDNREYAYKIEKKEIARHLLFKKVINYSTTNKLINSAHNISSQGLFHSLVEASVQGNFGFDITTDSEIRKDIYLFGNQGGRILITASPEKEDKLIDCLVDLKVPFTMLGHVTKEELRIDDISYGFISDVRKIYLKAFGKMFENEN